MQRGPQARRGELPATPTPPPHSPCSSESPSTRAAPKSRRGTRLVGFPPLRGSCPPAPSPQPNSHGRWSHPRAPCVRRGVGGPPKGLVSGPIRVRRLRLCALPRQRTLGGWRGSICSQSLSRYRPKCTSGRGGGGLSCGPLGEWDGADATAAPASSFVSARGRCSTLEPPDDGGAVARPPVVQRTQPCRCSRRRRCRRRRAADPAPLVCGCTPWRSHTRWWPLCVHVQSSRIVLDPPTPLSPFTL